MQVYDTLLTTPLKLHLRHNQRPRFHFYIFQIHTLNPKKQPPAPNIDTTKTTNEIPRLLSHIKAKRFPKSSSQVCTMSLYSKRRANAYALSLPFQNIDKKSLFFRVLIQPVVVGSCPSHSVPENQTNHVHPNPHITTHLNPPLPSSLLPHADPGLVPPETCLGCPLTFPFPFALP